MKKVKLMLVSLSVFAVVGGALAFTAKSGPKVCTADVLGDGSCPQYCPTAKKLSLNPTSAFICTAPLVINGFDDCHVVSGAQTTVCIITSTNSTVE